MKKRMLALCLGMSLLLSGCAAMLERSHVSSTAHVDFAVEEEDDESILRAETYQGLVKSMLYFIDGHKGGGVIRLYNYTGDVESDLAAARDEVLQDPVGAFAVGTLGYDSTRILTYYEVKLTIRYTRTAREVEAIPEVMGLSGVRQELSRMVAGGQDSAVFLASYFSGDRDLVEQMLNLVCYSGPGLFWHHHNSGFGDEAEAAADYVSVNLYPETGARRIIEVKLVLPYGAGTDEEAYAGRLEGLASVLLEENPPAGEGYTVEELAAVVRSASGPWDDDGGSKRAYDVLSGEAAADFGLLMAMEHLCQQCGIGVEPVEGPEGLWLIVDTPGGSRHLLAESLRPLPEDPGGEEPEPPFRLYTDQELIAIGYEWPASLYPVCVNSGEAAESGEPGQE